MPKTDDDGVSSGESPWLHDLVEPTAALTAASGFSAPDLDALLAEWQLSDDAVALLMARIEDETLLTSTRVLAVLLLVIEMSDRGRDAVLSHIATHAPSLAGTGIGRAVELNFFALATLMVEADMWSTRPSVPLSALLDRLEHDSYAVVAGMCALAVAMMGPSDVVGPPLLRQLRTAHRHQRAAGAALGLSLCSSSSQVQEHLRNGARTDPHEEVRAACYIGLAMQDCDASEGLFDVHSEVRLMTVLLLDAPLTARQRSRLSRVMGDKTMPVRERAVAAAALLDDGEIDELVPQIVAFLTSVDEPEVLPLIDQFLEGGHGTPEMREQISANAHSIRETS